MGQGDSALYIRLKTRHRVFPAELFLLRTIILQI